MSTLCARIARQKLEKRRSLFAWYWLYSVQIMDGRQPVAVGTRLDEAITWAKSHGATQIIKDWL